MLIHPWDAAVDAEEWRGWFAATDRFGVLAVNHRDPAQAPLVVPAHATLAGEELLLHLARPNPVWPHLEAAEQVRFAVVGDYAYVPTTWRAAPGTPPTDGVPTSYYASVQFVCRPTVVDDPGEKAAVLAAQLADRQPAGDHAQLSPDAEPYGRMLPGLRAIRLAILQVEAKFKFDDAKSVEHRERVIDHLEQRATGTDRGAADQQRRRLAAVGDWQEFRARG
ncbi:MAG: FMN-binding negative transcriptional regulator [Kineosporiaceae bacterium]